MNHVEFMRLAEAEAKNSVCKRAQVGAAWHCLDGDIHVGHNNNDGQCCEGEDGRTLPTVTHAECMALEANLFLDEQPGGTLYVTRQPCVKCARLIVEAGISQVFYRDTDDKADGLELLAEHGVLVDCGWIAGQRDPLIEPSLMEKIQASWLARWSV